MSLIGLYPSIWISNLFQLQETNTVLSEGAKGFCLMVSQVPTIPKPTEPNRNDKWSTPIHFIKLFLYVFVYHIYITFIWWGLLENTVKQQFMQFSIQTYKIDISIQTLLHVADLTMFFLFHLKNWEKEKKYIRGL